MEADRSSRSSGPGQDPFGIDGSVSLGLYRHDVQDPSHALALLVEQARAGEAAGFDGLTLSEHHFGRHGYFPNPLYGTQLVLQATSRVWAGPMPMVLSLRPAATVVEDLAWMAAAYPRRVAAAFAAGNEQVEQALNPGSGASGVERFEEGMRVVAGALGIIDPSDWLISDPAIAKARGEVPLLSAVRSLTAAARAASLGVGQLFSPVLSVDVTKRCVDEYRLAGGIGSCALIRRVLVVPRPGALSSPPPDDEWTLSGPAESVLEQLVTLAEETGADAFNLRVHYPGMAAPIVLEQLERIGVGILPELQQQLRGKTSRDKRLKPDWTSG